jgi:hypothetical protein
MLKDHYHFNIQVIVVFYFEGSNIDSGNLKFLGQLSNFVLLHIFKHLHWIVSPQFI